MAVSLLKLKKDAVAAGMDKDKARTASRATLEGFLSGGSRKAPVKKAAAVKKSTATKKAPARKATPATKSTPARKAPAAKKATTRKAPVKASSGDVAGRNQIDTLDFNETENWNPRVGSAVEMIFKALKKARGNVDKAFEILKPNIKDFVGAKKQDGTLRTKADREAMLRYRINRTRFDFAVKTGQHEIATDRVEYGTGAYAAAKKKPVRKPTASAKKAATRTTARKPAAKRKVAAKR